MSEEKTGLTNTSYYSIVNDKTVPSLQSIYALAQALDCPPGWLAFGDLDVLTWGEEK